MIRNSSNKKIIHCNLMQAFVSTAHNEIAALVIHNTRACSSIALRAYYGLRSRASGADRVKLGKGNNLFCTALTDRDAVFGGGDRLEQCLTDICRERHPEYILVACGCVPGVTGDDVATVCNTVREKTGVPVLLLPGFGFMVPGLLDMVLAATDLLCSEFTFPLAGKVKRREDAAAIIGLSAYYIGEEAFREVREFFSLLGITKIYCPPVGETKKDYEEMAAVSMAASLCLGVVQKEAGKQLARKFANKIQVPVLDMNASYEPSDTERVLQTAGNLLGRNSEFRTVIRDKASAYGKKRDQAAALLRGKSCLLTAGIPFRFLNPRGTIRFLQSLGLKVNGFLVSDTVRSEKQEEIDRFIRDNRLNMGSFSMENAAGAADFLVTPMPVRVPMKQFIFQPQHFSFEGWCREIDRLTDFLTDAGGGTHA